MGDVAADISEAAPLRGRHLASRPAGHGSGLAKASKTSADTVTGFEARGSNPKLLTVMAWRRALEKAGVDVALIGEVGEGRTSIEVVG